MNRKPWTGEQLAILRARYVTRQAWRFDDHLGSDRRQRRACARLAMADAGGVSTGAGRAEDESVMPIKPENIARYPKNWNAIRARILERAGFKCEECGIANYRLGGRTRDGQWHDALPLGEKLLSVEWPSPGTFAYCVNAPEPIRIIRIVLTIAHLDHVPENCADDNLRAWCQRCHLAYDHEHHQRNAYETRRKGRAVADLFEVSA